MSTLKFCLLQEMLRKGSSVGPNAAENVFQEAADALWSSHLEVEIAGLRAGTTVDNGNEPGQADALASCQWALQSCRCLVKLVSSKLSVRIASTQVECISESMHKHCDAVRMLSQLSSISCAYRCPALVQAALLRSCADYEVHVLVRA